VRGPAIVPGRPEESVLIEALRHEGELQMPPGPKLPRREIRVLTEWIRRGAPMDPIR
jgi:Planctomycete cytochrome C